ncbi:MAG: OmpA family protein [bacterium]|nr:OmpA family protein [bacterium]
MFVLIGTLTILFLLTLLLLPAVVRASGDRSATDAANESAGSQEKSDAGDSKKKDPAASKGDPEFARKAREFQREGRLVLPAINFRPNEAAIDHPTDALRRHLELVVDRLETDDAATVLVSGHTDRQGSREHNLQLSLSRAQAVCDLLENDYGVAVEKLRAAGRGYSEPAADNASPAGRQKNRRVEIQIEGGLER